jgi:hypothetical protein
MPTLIDYVELDALKATLSIEGAMFLDDDLRIAISAGSRAIDEATYRYFGPGEDPFEVRYYSPSAPLSLEIDDLVELVSLDLDLSGNGDYATNWEPNVDFYLEPLNAAAKNKPYERLIANERRKRWPRWRSSVRVMGTFGWAAVPPGVVEATGILAARLVRRARETPYAIATVSIETGTALRIIRTDPDVAGLLDGLIREAVLA